MLHGSTSPLSFSPHTISFRLSFIDHIFRLRASPPRCPSRLWRFVPMRLDHAFTSWTCRRVAARRPPIKIWYVAEILMTRMYLDRVVDGLVRFYCGSPAEHMEQSARGHCSQYRHTRDARHSQGDDNAEGVRVSVSVIPVVGVLV